MSEKEKALIAMSGGVDSSVAAYLMKEKGFDCIGCTMKLFSNEDIGITGDSKCCSLDDVEDARSVARNLGIPYYVFNFKEGFREAVIDPFVCAYENGETPNPCIDCNNHLKFGSLFRRAKELSCDYVVTGHYVRVEEGPDGYILKKAIDPGKDQSYVLYNLSQEQLSHIKFPLGELTKEETRALANEAGFINSDKPDSQDICFVPDGDYACVIETLRGHSYQPGNFLDMEGNILGTHKGIIHYTIGQRKGLGLSLKEPMYVVKLDVPNNAVILGRNEDLFYKEVKVKSMHYISGKIPDEPFRCQAKIRYRHTEQPATATPLPDNHLLITFDEAQRAPTPGQSAVLYDGDIVLGGGIIEL